MKQSEIPVYTDPDDFDATEITFPCSTQYMMYNALVSRYELTIEALEDYGIDAGMLDSGNPKAIKQFIVEVSDDLYGVMAHLAPFNYLYHCWRVAQALSRQCPERYTARKQFEKALIYQAQYKAKNADVRDFNGIDLEGGQSIYFKQLRKEFRHVSPKVMDILQALGLLFNGSIPGKQLIDVRNGM